MPAVEVPEVNPSAIVRSVVVDPSAEVPSVNPTGVINDLTVDGAATVPIVNPSGVIRDLSISADAVTPEVNPAGVVRSLSIDPTIPPLTVDMQATSTTSTLIPRSIPPLDLSGIGVNLPNIPDQRAGERDPDNRNAERSGATSDTATTDTNGK